MKQCIIFDMDGVIVDSEPLHQLCEKEIFKMLGISVPENIHSSFVGSTDELMWSKIAEIYNLPVNIPDIIGLKKSLYLKNLREKEISPIEGVFSLLTELFQNGFFIALATSAPHEQIDFILNTFNIKHFFHSIISGEDVKNGKPDPEIFITVSKSIGIVPKSCIVIEDSYNGIIAAKKAGMKCIGYKNPHSGNQDLSKADIEICSLNEISLDLLRNKMFLNQA